MRAGRVGMRALPGLQIELRGEAIVTNRMSTTLEVRDFGVNRDLRKNRTVKAFSMKFSIQLAWGYRTGSMDITWKVTATNIYSVWTNHRIYNPLAPCV